MAVTDPSFNPSGDGHVAKIKQLGSELGAYIQEQVEPGRRKAVALTQLETALMWAVKAAIVGDE